MPDAPDVPVYLPVSLPAGFALDDEFVIQRADGPPMTNPTTWNGILGRDAGHGAALSDGQDSIVLWVNPAADWGDGVEFAPLDARLLEEYAGSGSETHF